MPYTVTECLGYIKELFFPTEPEYKKLVFTQEAYAKLLCYINLIGEYEITGFGRVVEDKVVDIKILKQEVKKATVDCDVDAMNEFLINIPRDQIGQWVLDWHSHVDMGVHPSGTDTNNYKEQYKARLSHQYPFMIVNKQQNAYCQCYISPSRQTDIELSVEQEGLTQEKLNEIYAECKESIETLCSKYEPKTTYNKTNYVTCNRYGYDYDEDDWNGYYRNSCTNNKKKDSTEYTKKVGEKNEQPVITSDDYEEFCWGCGTYLIEAEEYDRHMCDECWEQMSLIDKQQWIRDIISKK